jgi:hypothetical protein
VYGVGVGVGEGLGEGLGEGEGLGPGLGPCGGIKMGVGVGVGVGAGAVMGVGAGEEPGTGGRMVMIGISPGTGVGVVCFRVTPLRRITATAFPPDVPSSPPSISRPKVSCKPEGSDPSIVSWTGLVMENALLGVIVSVSSAGSNSTERIAITRESLAVNDPFASALTSR